MRRKSCNGVVVVFLFLLLVFSFFGNVNLARADTISVTIWAWESAWGWLAEPITLDGAQTGYKTPHTFTLSNEMHYFYVPTKDTNGTGKDFGGWNNGNQFVLIVNSSGTYTALYGAYAAVVEAFAPTENGVWSQISQPITVDGTQSGYSTPYTFVFNISETHTLAVPDYYSLSSDPFYKWGRAEPNYVSGSIIQSSQPVSVSYTSVYTAIYQPPLSAYLTPGGGYWTMDLGQAQTFTTMTYGGSGSYWYMWAVDDVQNYQLFTSPSFDYSPTSTGSHKIEVTPCSTLPPEFYPNLLVSLQPKPYVTITVNPALTTPSISSSPDNITLGASSALSITGLTDGTTPYSYEWLQKAPGATAYSVISGATSNTYTFSTTSSTATGTWNFMVQVTDSASQPVTLTSNPVEVTVQMDIPEVSSGMLLVLFFAFLSTAALIFGGIRLRKEHAC